MKYPDVYALKNSEDGNYTSVKLFTGVLPPVRTANCTYNTTYRSDHKKTMLSTLFVGIVTSRNISRRMQTMSLTKLKQANQEKEPSKNDNHVYSQKNNNSSDHSKMFRSHSYKSQDKQVWSRYHKNGKENDIHQTRGSLIRIFALPTSTTNAKLQTTWINCGCKQTFYLELKMFSQHKRISKAILNTYRGFGMILEQRRDKFKFWTLTIVSHPSIFHW